jgi:hypothetical protein
LGPRVEIIFHGPHNLAIAQCIEVRRWQGGGRVPTPYNNELFFWWRRHVIALDDYPYTRIDFKGDPDMPLPLGTAYGDIDMSIFLKYLIFFYFCIGKQKYFWMMLIIK